MLEKPKRKGKSGPRLGAAERMAIAIVVVFTICVVAPLLINLLSMMVSSIADVPSEYMIQTATYPPNILLTQTAEAAIRK